MLDTWVRPWTSARAGACRTSWGPCGRRGGGAAILRPGTDAGRTWEAAVAHDRHGLLDPCVVQGIRQGKVQAHTAFFSAVSAKKRLETKILQLRREATREKRDAFKGKLNDKRTGMQWAYKLLRTDVAPSLTYLVQDGEVLAEPLAVDAKVREDWGAVFAGNDDPEQVDDPGQVLGGPGERRHLPCGGHHGE